MQKVAKELLGMAAWPEVAARLSALVCVCVCVCCCVCVCVCVCVCAHGLAGVVFSGVKWVIVYSMVWVGLARIICIIYIRCMHSC